MFIYRTMVIIKIVATSQNDWKYTFIYVHDGALLYQKTFFGFGILVHSMIFTIVGNFNSFLSTELMIRESYPKPHLRFMMFTISIFVFSFLGVTKSLRLIPVTPFNHTFALQIWIKHSKDYAQICKIFAFPDKTFFCELNIQNVLNFASLPTSTTK